VSIQAQGAIEPARENSSSPARRESHERAGQEQREQRPPAPRAAREDAEIVAVYPVHIEQDARVGEQQRPPEALVARRPLDLAREAPRRTRRPPGARGHVERE
jgi:hypothetical protein